MNNIAFEFLNDLKKSIELSELKKIKEPSKTYKPSSLNCIRNMYFQIKGYKLDFKPNYILSGICETGTDMHSRIQNHISNMINNNIDCQYVNVEEYVLNHNLNHLDIIEQQGNETKLYNKELNLSFLCDGVIKYHNQYYIIEIKTETENKWVSRISFDKKHKNQAIAYSVSLKLDNVIYIYVNRNNRNMRTFIYKVSNKDRKELVNKIRTCNEYVNKNELPPKPNEFIKNENFCVYCNYKKYCTNNDKT